MIYLIFSYVFMITWSTYNIAKGGDVFANIKLTLFAPVTFPCILWFSAW